MELLPECQDPMCKNERKFYCEDHKIAICSQCDYRLHVDCHTAPIQEMEEVKQNLNFVGKLLQVFNHKAMTSNAEFYIPQTRQKLLILKEEFKVLEDRVKEACWENASLNGERLNSELKEFHIKLKNDEFLKKLNHISTVHEASDLENYTSIIDQQRKRMEKANSEVLKKYKSRLDSDFQTNTEEFKAKFQEECTQRIQTLCQEQIDGLKTLLETKEQDLVRETMARDEVERKAQELDDKVQAQEEEIKREVGLREEAEKDKEEMKKEMVDFKQDIKERGESDLVELDSSEFIN